MVEKVTEVTGIKAAVEKLTDDCGCKERKQALNKLIPFPRHDFKKMSAEDQVQYRTLVLPEWETGLITEPVKQVMAVLYVNAYNRPAPHMSRCRSRCVLKTLEELEQVYMQSCDGQD